MPTFHTQNICPDTLGYRVLPDLIGLLQNCPDELSFLRRALARIEQEQKGTEILAVVQGIKGQYLIFDTGVINIRKFTSYEVTVSD